jgi:hypothetical protein
VDPDTEAAIRSIGTNGIPFYLEWLPREFPRQVRLKMFLASFSRKFIAHNWRPELQIQKRSDGALVAMNILKERAAAAIPRLVFYATNEMNTSNFVNQKIAIRSLAEIGAPAEPALASLTTNSHLRVRNIAGCYSATARRKKKTTSDLQLLLEDATPELRRFATNSLHESRTSTR